MKSRKAVETQLLRLAVAVYEAAAEPELWSHFLQLYNDAISSAAALLQIHDFALNKSTIVSAFGIGTPFQQSYHEYYSQRNIWRNRGRPLYVPGAVSIDTEHCPRIVTELSEFYNDYLRRMGLAYSMGGVIARRKHQAPTLTSLRGRRKGEFGEAERSVAKFLMPHLSRAWALFEKLEILAAGESVLDTLPLGIVFLAADGVPLYSNGRAEEVFRADDGLTIQSDKLCARDRIADAQLRRAIHQALSLDRPPGRIAIGIARLSFRRPYEVVVAPLLTRFRQFIGAPSPRAVLFIADPEWRAPSKSDLLIQLYGLTRKEAEIATKLTEAKSVEQVAEALGITYETTRTHLRRIFTKTQTSRQTELLMRIAMLPGGGAPG